MASWGAYFNSYVKKPDGAGAGPSSRTVVVDGSQFPMQQGTTNTISVDTLKRSGSTAKKLYDIPTETPKEIPQRSTSNAARVANLFGYANQAPAKAKLGGVVEQAMALEKTREDTRNAEMTASLLATGTAVASTDLRGSQAPQIVAGLPPDFLANATFVKAAPLFDEKLKKQESTMDVKVAPVVVFRELRQMSDYEPDLELAAQGNGQKEVEAASKELMFPKRTNALSISKLDNDVLTMLDTFASQAPGVLTSDQRPAKQDEQVSRAKSKLDSSKAKNDTQTMLELFASQAKALDVKDTFGEETTIKTPITEVKFRTTPKSRLKESLTKLDFFAGQADVNTQTQPKFYVEAASGKQKSLPAAVLGPNPESIRSFENPEPKNARAIEQQAIDSDARQHPVDSEKASTPSSRRNKSLELLDFFAKQAMTLGAANKPLMQQNQLRQADLAPVQEDAPLEVLPQLQLQKRGPTETKSIAPSTRTLERMRRLATKAKRDATEQQKDSSAVAGTPAQAPANPSIRPKTVAEIPLSRPSISPKKMRPLATLNDATVPVVRKRMSSIRSSAISFEIRNLMDDQENEMESTTLFFRERFIEYEKQAEQIRLEKEAMEMEHMRMLEEISMFQKEADRIAEEEEAMKKFVKNLETERLQDLENEDRKRREREARLKTERLERERIENDRFEQKRLARNEKERIRIEAADRVRITKADANRLFAEAEIKEIRDRLAREERERVARERKLALDAEIEATRRRKEQARIEEEKRMKEEIDRLNADMLRYAAEAEAERLLVEEQLEREQAERRKMERKEEDARVERKELQYQQEQERIEEQREEEERLERQQRREIREEEERWQDEQEMAEEEARYAEQDRRFELQQRIDEEARYADQRRAVEQQKRKDNEARYAEQGRRGRQRKREDDEVRVVEQQRLVTVQRQTKISEEDSDEEDEIVKAERKIKEAFAGLAKERGQAPPIVAPVAGSVRRANIAQNRLQQLPQVNARVSRNNTVGARPQIPRGDQTVMRSNTLKPRPQIAGGLPSGPRRRA